MNALELNATLAALESDGVNLGLAELVRYKAISRQLNLRPSSAIRSAMSGAMVSKFKGRGMEFDEARHYQPGDDIRSIDWRVTARTGHTHTKVYREERERPVLVYLDLQKSMHFGTQLMYKSVQAVHACALIMFSALARGDKIGLIAINEHDDIERKPKSTAKHVLSMLNQLINMHNQNNQINGKPTTSSAHAQAMNSKASGLNKLAMLAKPGTLVYVLSDFANYDQRCFDTLGKLQRHCEIKPIHVFDPIEENLPSVSSTQAVTLSNGQQEQSVILGDRDISNAYNSKRNKWQSYLQEEFSSLGLELRRLNAAKTIQDQLIASRAGLVLGSTL